MGREIKFRAWDKRQNLMREVSSVDMLGNCCVITGKIEGSINMLAEEFRNKANIVLMQYTGLKDKNGKEIYEGDIVSYGMDNPAVCQWHQEESRFIFYQKFRSGGGASLNHCGHYLLKGDTYNEVEIIGNIYENADLLTTSDRQQ